MEERLIDTSEARVRVLVRDGDPSQSVIFLHGLTSSASTWEPFLEGLPEGVRGIAYDSLGGGYTEALGPREPITIDRQTKLLLDLADRFEIHRLVLVGHSMGCASALRAGWQERERVGAMLLVCPSALGRRRLTLTQRLARRRPTAWLLEAGSPLFARSMARAALRELNQDPGDEHLVRREAGHALDDPRQAARNMIDIIGHGDVRLSSVDSERWARIAALVWILRGENDLDWMPEEHEERYRRLIPQAKLMRWDGVGHAPQVEAPERFQALLDEFFAAAGIAQATTSP